MLVLRPFYAIRIRAARVTARNTVPTERLPTLRRQSSGTAMVPFSRLQALEPTPHHP
jgi:hypothetical protein